LFYTFQSDVDLDDDDEASKTTRQLLTSLLAGRPSRDDMDAKGRQQRTTSKRRQPKSASVVVAEPTGGSEDVAGDNPPLDPPTAPEPTSATEIDQSVMPSPEELDAMATFMGTRVLVGDHEDAAPTSQHDAWCVEARQTVEELLLMAMPWCSCEDPSQPDDVRDLQCPACRVCADLLELRLDDAAVARRREKNTRLGELLRVAPVLAAIHSLVSSSQQRDKVRYNIPHQQHPRTASRVIFTL